MPELPEVESIRRGHEPRLVGACLTRVDLHRGDIVTGDASPHALLEGATIARLDRRGKQLAIIALDGRTLVVHLGMSGQLRWQPFDAPAVNHDHVHADWTVTKALGGDPSGTLVFRDPRRFGGLRTLADEGALARHWGTLGPDALGITAADLADACRATRRAVKPVLLDQRVLAGVGNIYADESLFAARIHPARAADTLREDEFGHLASSIRSVLARAIDAGGSTLRDYVNADGAPGGFAHLHAVYGRGGKPCRRCSTTLRADVLGQRTTVWCPVCQPRRPRRSKPIGR